MKSILLSSIATAFLTTAAYAEKVDVKIDVLHEVEMTDANGDKVVTREPLDVATPDQTVIYKITLKNEEKDPVSDVVLNIPISDALTIQPQSFTADVDMTVTFSVDGVAFEKFDALTVDDRKANADDLTKVKITIPELPQAEVFFVEYDAIVK
jgi:uncharacterized repeat protein (TIGR01451 family)